MSDCQPSHDRGASGEHVQVVLPRICSLNHRCEGFLAWVSAPIVTVVSVNVERFIGRGDACGRMELLRYHLVRRRLDGMVNLLEAIAFANADAGDVIALKLNRQDPVSRAELIRG